MYSIELNYFVGNTTIDSTSRTITDNVHNLLRSYLMLPSNRHPTKERMLFELVHVQMKIETWYFRIEGFNLLPLP